MLDGLSAVPGYCPDWNQCLDHASTADLPPGLAQMASGVLEPPAGRLPNTAAWFALRAAGAFLQRLDPNVAEALALQIREQWHKSTGSGDTAASRLDQIRDWIDDSLLPPLRSRLEMLLDGRNGLAGALADWEPLGRPSLGLFEAVSALKTLNLQALQALRRGIELARIRQAALECSNALHDWKGLEDSVVPGRLDNLADELFRRSTPDPRRWEDLRSALVAELQMLVAQAKLDAQIVLDSSGSAQPAVVDFNDLVVALSNLAANGVKHGIRPVVLEVGAGSATIRSGAKPETLAGFPESFATLARHPNAYEHIGRIGDGLKQIRRAIRRNGFEIEGRMEAHLTGERSSPHEREVVFELSWRRSPHDEPWFEI